MDEMGIPSIEEVARYLIDNKKFTVSGAYKAAKSYVETRKFVLDEEIKYWICQGKHNG